MSGDFGKFIYRAVAGAWVWLAFGGGAVSWLSNLLEMPVSSYMWMNIAFFCMFIAVLRAYWLLVKQEEREKQKEQEWQREREKNRPLQPDMFLKDVVERIVGPEIYDEDNYDFSAALRTIQQQALLGHIVVFGAEGTFLGDDTGPGGSGGPYIPIPAAYWRSYSIDVLSYLRDGAGKIGPGDNSGATYYDLMFDRRQIDQAWPEGSGTSRPASIPQMVS